MELIRNFYSFTNLVKFKFILKVYYLLLLLILFSCQKKDNNYYESIALNDVLLPKAQAGDWRYSHEEKFQNFEDFRKKKRIVPKVSCNIIYLQPIGSFNDLQKKEINLTEKYLKSYFQLDVKVLPVLSNDIFPKSVRRISKEGQEQILAGYVLNDILIKRKPKDAVAVMGTTEKDLYPKPEWNYVFGIASYEDGVGVTSMYRFANGNLTELNFNKSLERLIKISSHEIGHMFGINHCLNANCVMNGTNSITETDDHFARACSLCQQKLNSSLHYDNKKRLLDLKQFFEKQHLTSELTRTEQDLSLLN